MNLKVGCGAQELGLEVMVDGGRNWASVSPEGRRGGGFRALGFRV